MTSKTSQVVTNTIFRVVILFLTLVTVITVRNFTDHMKVEMSKIVAIAERNDERIGRMFEGAAPLGAATVEKAKKAVDNVDGEDLGKAAQEGIKDIGNAAKESLKGFLGKEDGNE